MLKLMFNGGLLPMTANYGLEHSFLASWQGWDEVGSGGDICFYDCVLQDHLKEIQPEETKLIVTIFLMSESTVQFDFYGEAKEEDFRDSYLGSRTFKMKAFLEEEIPCD